MSAEQELRDLKDLLDIGAITQEEYARKRQHVLSKAKESGDKGKAVTRGSSARTPEQPQKTVVRRKRVERGKSDESDDKGIWIGLFQGLLVLALLVSVTMYFVWDYLPNGMTENADISIEEVVPDAVDPVVTEVAEESVEESIDFAVKVRDYLTVQNTREIERVLDFWDDGFIQRYYEIKHPHKHEIKRAISDAWMNTVTSTNSVMNLSRVSSNTIDATIHFEFQRLGQESKEYVVTKNRYTFSNDGRLIEERLVETIKRGGESASSNVDGFSTINADKVNFRRQPNLDDWVKSEESGVMVPNKIRELNKGERAQVISGQGANQTADVYLLKKVERILDATGDTIILNPGVAVRVINVDGEMATCVATVDEKEIPHFDLDFADLDPMSNYNWKRVRIGSEEGYVLDRFLD
jgi:hydrogenase maturation factor